MIGKVALIFPGTGSQYIGMFKGLYDRYAIVRETFEEAEETFKLSLAEMCFADGFHEQESIAYAQVAILVCSVAAYRVLQKEVGLQPGFLAGHSLGEISALTCAGAFRLQDAVDIVQFRGEAMEQAVPAEGGALAAIKHLSLEQVKEACETYSSEEQSVYIACCNAKDQHVIAGHRSAVQQVSCYLEEQGAQVISLSSTVPFHTPLMAPAAAKLREKLQQVKIQAPVIPVIANVSALPYAPGAEAIIDLVARQLTVPVRWEETVRYLQQQGASYAIELGPNAILKKLVKRTAPNIRAYAIDDAEDWKSILSLKKLQPTFLDRCLSIAVTTRNQNDDPEEYRSGVIEPYQQILRSQQESEQNGQRLSPQQARLVLQQLESILRTKKVPEVEQQALLQEAEELLDRTLQGEVSRESQVIMG